MTILMDAPPALKEASCALPACLLSDSPVPPTHEQIARRAYELYENSGREGERDVEFWLAAEKQLMTNA